MNDYLAAVKAGLPMAEVAPFLARIYKVDIATVMPPETKKPEPRRQPEVVEFTLPQTHSTVSTIFTASQVSPEPDRVLIRTNSGGKKSIQPITR